LDNSKIIDGKLIASKIQGEIKTALEHSGITPGIALILVGSNPASEVYVKMKAKRSAELGYYSVVDRQPETISEKELLGLIHKYNSDDRIHGILVQLPLPEHVDEMKVIDAIDYKKDVDGFHPINAGRMLIGKKCFLPCTPAGIYELFKRYDIETSGKNLVVIGRSNIVGKPIANIMLQKEKHANSTVTVCHSATPNIKEHTLRADIIVAAIGRANFLTADMIKEGCVIIDVGINRVKDDSSKSGYKISGDVNFDECYPKASRITPVPGGIGPMTIAMLLKNTYDAATKAIYP
jgi:methylenetetrahydrofolate dehydrogenase (NADP+)/methenyltetrahydrofolate cyclohydrolase